jgi:tRNA(Arg) A34 adenosine deaminase TadA
MPRLPVITIACPDWVGNLVDFDRAYDSAEARMRVAISCASENVQRGTGGPFGAAIFERDSGRLVAVGVNLVVPLNNSTAHAEMVAFMLAQAARGSWSLAAPGLPAHELHTSCEPCAMCLGAVLWSGIRHVAWSALRQDADDLDFDEGPVFAASYDYLQARGISFSPGLLRDEGRAVLESYRDRGGPIYNG